MRHRLTGAILLLYPRRVRKGHGPEIVALIDDLVAHEGSSRVRLFVRLAVDGLVQRVASTATVWTVVGGPGGNQLRWSGGLGFRCRQCAPGCAATYRGSRVGYRSPAGIGSASAARPGAAGKGSAKYWVSWVTRPSVISMTLTEFVGTPS